MKIIEVFVAVWAVTWIFAIVRCVRRFQRSKEIRLTFNDLLTKTDLENAKQRKIAINKALLIYPEASKIVGYNSPIMSHTFDDRENVRAMVDFVNYLSDSIDWDYEELREQANPLRTLQTIFRAPSWLLEQFGLTLKLPAANLLSFLAWLIPIVAALFSTDIREFILQLLR